MLQIGQTGTRELQSAIDTCIARDVIAQDRMNSA
jgi:hypothetical protein